MKNKKLTYGDIENFLQGFSSNMLKDMRSFSTNIASIEIDVYNRKINFYKTKRNENDR